MHFRNKECKRWRGVRGIPASLVTTATLEAKKTQLWTLVNRPVKRYLCRQGDLSMSPGTHILNDVKLRLIIPSLGSQRPAETKVVSTSGKTSEVDLHTRMCRYTQHAKTGRILKATPASHLELPVQGVSCPSEGLALYHFCTEKIFEIVLHDRPGSERNRHRCD